MSRAVVVAGRVARADGVDVLVPLGRPEVDESTTRFLEPGDDVPAETLVLRAVEPGRDDRDALTLLTVLDVLAPHQHARLRERLTRTRKLDNRLDLEADLRGWADLVEGLIVWWNAQPRAWREARRGAVAARHRSMAQVLDLPALGDGRVGRRTARPLAELLPHRVFGVDRVDSAPADVDWERWVTRDAREILSDRGGLRQLMGDGFESRPGQVDMAVSVDEAIGRRRHLVVEAGTGIGKSLAYLVPALLAAARRRERVVVSTHTKALQAQLMERDLPLLSRLGYPGRARLLLGRNNYLCRRQLRRVLAHRAEGPTEALAQLAMAVWAQQSAEGLREELVDHPWFEPYWRAYFESVEPCSPHICHPEPACFVVAARRVARDADVVTVNHALLMMDLKSGQQLIGPSRLLVVDEAHQLAEVATRALSTWISPSRLEIYRNLAGDRLDETRGREVLHRLAQEPSAGPELGTRARATDVKLEYFMTSFEAWYRAVERHCRTQLDRQAGRPGSHRIHDSDEAFGPVREDTDALRSAGAQLDGELNRLCRLADQLDPDVLGDEREGLRSLLEVHRDTMAQLDFVLTAEDEDWVHWFEWAGEGGLTGVVSAPLSVEQSFVELWDRHFDSVVLTSATLAVGEDFQPFAESVGIAHAARPLSRLQIPSPFAFEQNSLILTSLDLSSPDDPAFASRVAAALVAITRRLATKILVLATSYKLIDALAHELREQIPEDDLFREAPDVRLLVQTPHTSRTALADDFRAAHSAILVATGSFWEGVDFPGRELEVLVVPRLPFSVPTDPLVEGRYERARRHGRDPFQEVALVDAVLRLKQGVGRLLRSAEDRGVVLLLDQRLQGKAYGVSFLQSLPRTCELVSSLEEMAPRVVEFLDAGRAQQQRGGG